MLKRLIIAVLAMGLVLAFSGTAISDVGTRTGLNPVMKIDPTNARFNDILVAGPDQPNFRKPESAFREAAMPGGVPTVPSAGYFCDFQSYYDPEVTNVYIWSIPDEYGDDLFNTRFTVEEGITCTLKVGWILMYGPGMTGTPDMRMYLWDDDGFGFPGNMIDSGDVAYADLPTGFGWVGVDWSAGNYVFTENEEYHIGWTLLGGPGDTLWCASDQATGPHDGEERSSENWNGFWGSMLNDWGLDVIFLMESERCCADIPFSDCYTQNNTGGLNSYYWPAPHPIYGDSSYAQRVDIGGDDTLLSIDVYVYDPDDGTFGNDNITLRIHESNGGLPGADTASYYFPIGYPAYPAPITITYPAATIVSSDFFVSFSTDGIVDYESILSDDGSNGVGGSFSVWSNGLGWVDMFTGWGADVNFNFDINICRDQFSRCQWNSYYPGFAYFWRLPDRYGDYVNAQKVIVPSSMVGCRPQQVDWYLYDNGEPDIYTENSEVQIYADAAGLPGALMASIILTPNDYNMFPAVTSVDFTDAQLAMDGDYWVAIMSLSTDTLTGIRTLTDDIFTGGGGNFDGAAEGWDDGSGNLVWGLMWEDWGTPAEDQAFLVDVEHCCIPVPEWDCGARAGEDWSTLNHDQGRTSHSSNPLADAYADLTVAWQFEHPQPVGYTGPIIVQGKIICSFNDQYIVFDAASGLQDYVLSGYPLGSSIRCAPTVANVGGTDMIFVSGGAERSVAAYVFGTGALVWFLDEDANGTTQWGNFIVLNQGGTDVLYWGTNNGKIRAVEAATGVDVWTTDLAANTYGSGSTNGSLLFYSTDLNIGGEGDVYALSAATGNIMWQLSTPGLMMDALNPGADVVGEWFSSGTAYSDGEVYANSRKVSGGHPSDGVFYRIAAVSGDRLSAVRSQRSIYSAPAVDAGAVFINTYPSWVTPPLGGHILAFGRSTGTLKMVYNKPSGAAAYSHMAITCEPDGVPDLLIAGDNSGFIDFLSTENLVRSFRRRVDWGPGSADNRVLGIALGPSGDMAVADRKGGLYYLKKGARAPRPRLEVQSFRPSQAVVFGDASDYEVKFDSLFKNTGGADLTFGDIDVDANTFGFEIPAFASSYVGADIMERASSIADMLTNEGFRVKATPGVEVLEDGSMESVRDLDRGREVRNMAAAIPPAIFNAITKPLNGEVLAAGASIDLRFTIDQNLITRGPFVMYMLVHSDDEDYFLNSAARGNAPELLVTIVGGCLLDTVSMPFGVSSLNTHLVTNTGRIATGDWDPYGMEIDGFQDGFWQGTYIYGVSQHRLAMHSQAWAGGGEEQSWISMQPDPDFCDNDCAPLLQTDVPLCAPVSRNGGLDYDEIRGNMVCKSYIDSVQNFDDGGGWFWQNWGSPFDNTLTMGLYVNTRTVGAVNVPELNNMTIEFFEVTERNGDSVPGWKFGALMDCDIFQSAGGGADTAWYDASVSAGWASPVGQTGYAWGFIKLPFGCGLDPLKNVYSLNADQAMWHDSSIYFDSAYGYMSLPQGGFGQQVTGAPDMEFHATIAEHDFAGLETYKFAVATFGYNSLQNGQSSAEFAYNAHFANKWIGFGRGDVNDDQLINLGDIIRLAEIVYDPASGGAVPFEHLADVNVDGFVNEVDLNLMLAWYFDGVCGPGGCLVPGGGAWCIF